LNEIALRFKFQWRQHENIESGQHRFLNFNQNLLTAKHNSYDKQARYDIIS